MKKTYIIIILIILVIISGVFFYIKRGSDTAKLADGILSTKDGVGEFYVTAKNYSFVPSKITVKKGDVVKITFRNNEGTHDFKIDEYNIATRQTKSPATEFIEFTADKSGSFKYYSSVGTDRDRGMEGTLKVE